MFTYSTNTLNKSGSIYIGIQHYHAHTHLGNGSMVIVVLGNSSMVVVLGNSSSTMHINTWVMAVWLLRYWVIAVWLWYYHAHKHLGNGSMVIAVLGNSSMVVVLPCT